MTREYKQHQSFPLSLPSSILEPATDLASREGLSLNHFIGLAVAEKISRLDQGEVWTTTKQLSHLVSSVADPKSTDVSDFPKETTGVGRGDGRARCVETD
jgi:hypothetical protein